jgi:hypothetical protein
VHKRNREALVSKAMKKLLEDKQARSGVRNKVTDDAKQTNTEKRVRSREATKRFGAE